MGYSTFIHPLYLTEELKANVSTLDRRRWRLWRDLCKRRKGCVGFRLFPCSVRFDSFYCCSFLSPHTIANFCAHRQCRIFTAVLSALDRGLGSDGDLVQLLRTLTQIIDGTFHRSSQSDCMFFLDMLILTQMIWPLFSQKPAVAPSAPSSPSFSPP